VDTGILLLADIFFYYRVTSQEVRITAIIPGAMRQA
jgi:hypothetical protein